MSLPHPFLSGINDFLQTEFATNRYPADEQGGIYHPSERPVQRLGLALEPFPKLASWIQEHELDALWVHRPWQLDLTDLPPDIGIIAHHLPFDETLTMGFSPLLAGSLEAMNPPEPLGYKPAGTASGATIASRPIGMLLDVAGCEFDAWLETIKDAFGGYDRAEAGHSSGGWQPTSSRIAVVGAMTDALVREAIERGAHLYLTGAYRKPAQQAVDDTGIAVIAVGHRRTEEWGLRTLAQVLHDRFSIDCFIPE